MKTTFGFDTNQFFVVPNEVYAFYEDFKKRGASAESQWNAMFDQYKAKYPDLVCVSVLLILYIINGALRC